MGLPTLPPLPMSAPSPDVLEARLAALESAFYEKAAGSGSPTDALVSSLTALRASLLDAVAEAKQLRDEKEAAVKEVEKLKYQVTHLKRSFYEAANRASEAPPVVGMNSVGC